MIVNHVMRMNCWRS